MLAPLYIMTVYYIGSFILHNNDKLASDGISVSLQTMGRPVIADNGEASYSRQWGGGGHYTVA